MKTNFLVTLFYVAGFLCLSACSSVIPVNGEVRNTEPPKSQPPLVVTPGIKGTSVILNVGGTFEVHIPTIPSPGFEWVVEQIDSSMLVQEGKAAYVADDSPNSAGGMTVLRFRALAAGKTVISLINAKPAQGDVPSISRDTLAVSVEVN
jgi:predicted secreted protein